jgi:OmcA/MtrC family decaheme c-type cytochrome
MRIRSIWNMRWIILGALLALMAIPGLWSHLQAGDEAKAASKPVFGPHDKAFYKDERTVAFVRPGLTIKIVGAVIEADGTIKARVKLTDPRGLPLDREGVVTPGPVALSFLAATLPSQGTQYTAYTVRTQTSPITNRSAVQAASDSGGTFRVLAEGEYEYSFRTRAPASYDRTATHTIGAYGSRNLSEFDLPTSYDDDTFHFVPDGSAVRKRRDLIKTETCNGCHDPLAEHGGSRRSMELCNLCHTPQTVDPDTGNTVDMPVMIHKIHMGEDLPSVQAGGKYQIIGFGQTVHDYSTVVYPGDPRNCASCHKEGVAQPNEWLRPTRAACGSCHDNVNFATGLNHANLPQVSDSQCANCHTPQGELDFDVSILGAHTIPTKSSSLPGTVFDILRVEDGSAGKAPVAFSIKDKQGRPVQLSAMSRLALVLAGPASTDYST